MHPFMKVSMFRSEQTSLGVKQDTEPLQNDISSGFLFNVQLSVKANKVCYLGRS